MRFAEYEENRRLIERLQRSVTDGRVSHAYLFEGPETVDKLAFAKAFIKGVLCPDRRGENCGKCEICGKIDHDNHEDILYISKGDRASVRDSAIIEMQEHLKVKPLGSKSIAVIQDCDLMTTRAQNRLLKTLEEPVGNTLIILLSENMENLTQTILSRCVKFRINPSLDRTVGKKESNRRAKAEMIADMCLKREPYYKIKEVLGSKKFTDEEVSVMLDEIEEVYRKYITDNYSESLPKYDFDRLYDGIYTIEEARKEIAFNVSVNYVIKNLILKLGG